jgi:hypothetical protein
MLLIELPARDKFHGVKDAANVPTSCTGTILGRSSRANTRASRIKRSASSPLEPGHCEHYSNPAQKGFSQTCSSM